MKLLKLTKRVGTLYLTLGPILNKSLEVGGGHVPAWKDEGFDYHVRYCTQGDHAGLTFWIELKGYTFEFSLTDIRHWNYKARRFYRPGEEKAFEGYPHE